MLCFNLLCFTTLLTLTTIASPIDLLHSPTAALPPTEDPFYKAPANYEATTRGTILRQRPTPGNLTSITPHAASSYHILYRTTDALYNASWAVTTLFIPSNATTTASCTALLSYQIPYNTADPNGSPSYSLYTTIQAFPDIPAALSRGWCVSVPDFEGPHASFGLGIQEGHAVLDAVRAVTLSSSSPTPSISRSAMWGYSGGSIASEWAAELQPSYAPELNFSGMAIGGLPVNASSTILNAIHNPAVGGYFAGLAPSLLLGATSQFPTARAYLLSQLSPSGEHNATAFLSTQNMTYSQSMTAFQNQSIFSYFRDGPAILSAPPLKQIFDTNGDMGYHGIPAMPLFVYKSTHDELSPVADTDALVQRYCAVGVQIAYERNEIGGHLAEYVNGEARAMGWLERVLEGKYQEPKGGCVVSNVRINVTDSPL